MNIVAPTHPILLCVGVSSEWWVGAGCVCECPVSGWPEHVVCECPVSGG